MKVINSSVKGREMEAKVWMGGGEGPSIMEGWSKGEQDWKLSRGGGGNRRDLASQNIGGGEVWGGIKKYLQYIL